MGYGVGGAGGVGDQGFREIVPRCKPGPDFEACRQDLLIGGAGLVLWVAATFAVVGGLLVCPVGQMVSDADQD